MELVDSEDIEYLAKGLSAAKSPSDMLSSWLPLAKKYKGLRAMSCLSNYDRSGVPASLRQLPLNVRNKLIPYFDHERIYFMSDEIILSTLTKNNIEIPIDYTDYFDTNFASYIGTIVRGGDLKRRFCWNLTPRGGLCLALLVWHNPPCSVRKAWRYPRRVI
ncbi:hypothetical protein [Litoribacillus peritrichatus]|uniref:Uncharacterized protein n=1 Tax=Litoribacillus peritrichatus TaxID=718191 RepID=A0ABP7MG36_9GAMM